MQKEYYPALRSLVDHSAFSELGLEIISMTRKPKDLLIYDENKVRKNFEQQKARLLLHEGITKETKTLLESLSKNDLKVLITTSGYLSMETEIEEAILMDIIIGLAIGIPYEDKCEVNLS